MLFRSAEIFGEKNGFDIVIGNPPYVRQEVISPPNRLKSEVALAERQEYKEKLISSVKAQFPMIKKIDKKSDLYIYFYFHGLSLLNEKGIFCFITSNSWLDVGYGRDLQEFLLEYVPIHAIYDNPKRSFEHADVNTIIAIFGAPALREESFEEKIRTGMNAPWTKISNTAKFVMFKKPFEEAISAETMIDIENAEAKVKGVELAELVENIFQNDYCRIFAVTQEDLLEDGWEYPEEYNSNKGRFKRGTYDGNKWGGKYLRAPDIFYKLLERGKNQLVQIGKVVNFQRGITTGANEFFYISEDDQKKWQIEDEFLQPIIKSPRECKDIVVDVNKLKFKAFICNKSKEELENTNALKYIEWGENNKVTIKSGSDKGKLIIGFNSLRTLQNRDKWYSINEKQGNVFWTKETNERLGCFVSQKKILCDCRLYFGTASTEVMNTINCTITHLLSEVLARSNLGLGAKSLMVYEVNQFYIPSGIEDLRRQIILENRELQSVFAECGLDPTKPFREQVPNPPDDRKKLDDFVFDKFSLTEDERKEVYFSVCELVKQRLEKADSI